MFGTMQFLYNDKLNVFMFRYTLHTDHGSALYIALYIFLSCYEQI